MKTCRYVGISLFKSNTATWTYKTAIIYKPTSDSTIFRFFLKNTTVKNHTLPEALACGRFNKFKLGWGKVNLSLWREQTSGWDLILSWEVRVLYSFRFVRFLGHNASFIMYKLGI